VYNGHPRRHCFNYQGVAAPDGILVAMHGPVEGRRHDATVLSQSGLLERFRNDPDDLFLGKVIFGDPAYGCNDHVVSPIALASCGSKAAKFNAAMSSVRECVEWCFGRIKTLWAFVNFDKKLKARHGPVGKLFLVAVLLSNCHCCMQPRGNQTTMYFGLRATTLDEYLNL
jgi:hypothetical protein